MKGTVFLRIIALIVFTLFLLFLTRPDWENMGSDRTDKGRVPIAVLGDSDSHSYRDAHLGTRRGGDFHSVTYQWTEILARIRASEIDLGQFGYWGTRGIFYKIRSALGLDARTPRKQDFQYNFARSGSTCRELSPESYEQQSFQLVRLMDKEPDYWRDGLVIIRMGINDIGQWPDLKEYAAGNTGKSSQQAIIECLDYIHSAVKRVHQHHPSVKIVLIGIADNSNWPSAEETDDIGHANINKVLDVFDEGLIEIANNEANTLFIEDRAWFASLMGKRSPSQYVGRRHFSLGGSTTIDNTKGDHPGNIMLADGHTGTVANALWIRHVFKQINRHFGTGFTPLQNSEIADLVDPQGNLGIAPS